MSYPFTAEFKQSVDRSSTAWMRYCEAVHLAKRYLKIERDHAREGANTARTRAVSWINDFLDKVASKRGKASAEELRTATRSVISNERPGLMKVLDTDLTPP